MNRALIVTLVIMGAFALSVAPNATAHHGWADFDRSRKVEVTGVIIESKYENPHTFVRVKTDQGDWAVELAAVPRMKRHAISAEMIKPGTRVTPGWSST